MADYTMYLSKVGRLRVTVNGCKVVWFLGIREAVDAGYVEQFLPWALHGFKRRGVARTTLTYFICTVEGGKASIKQFSIQPHPTYTFNSGKICRVGLYTEQCCHPYLVLHLLICYPYLFNVLVLQ